ncbi:hypothetical protein ACIHDR_13390 [Nocardia sp. NPDC052278]|uniref:hypothetical protein n=1 Tax=unclassified Nocardia TaxID=2637762 RepID=UPI0036BE962D
MTGPEALGMVDIARHISAAVGRQIRYVDVPPEDKQREWIAAGYPPERAMAFGQLFAERRALGRAAVQQDTHDRLSVVPTTFTEFAMRNAAVFRGEADYAVTPG